MSFEAKLRAARGAGETTRTVYEHGQIVRVEVIEAPDGETIRANFDAAKRGPKSKAEKRGEASQAFASNPW